MRTHVDHAASMELIKNLWRLCRVAERQVELPNGAILILREPDRIVFRRHHHRGKRSVWNLEAVHRVELKRHRSFGRVSLVDSVDVPDADGAIDADREQLSFENEHLLDIPIVAAFPAFSADFDFDKSIIPNEEISRFASGNDFAVGKLDESVDIGNVCAAESSQRTLQLQTSESFGHSPESNVANTAGYKLAFNVWAERSLEDIERKSFRTKNDALSFPVPESQQVIGRGTDRSEKRSIVIELNVGETFFSATTEDVNDFKLGVRVDKNLGLVSFSTDSEEFL